MVTSKQATIRERDVTKKKKRAPKTNMHKPTKANKQEHDKGLDLSKQAWVQTQKAWKIANRAQTCKKELIQTLY